MRRVDISNGDWQCLLTRSQYGPEPEASDAEGIEPSVMALYGPIATARERFVLAQVGQSLDGRVATPAGDARDVSGPDGLAHLHRCRALVDAVVVGVGTVLADDPSLSVRIVKGASPVRVVIDCNGVLTGHERLLHDDGTPVIVVQADDAPRIAFAADVLRLRRGPNGLHPAAILDGLEAMGLRRLLVEGGARTIARFLDAGLVDRLHISVAPIIIGSGPSGISLMPVERLSQAHRPKVTAYDIGSDIVFDCQFERNEQVRNAVSGMQCQNIDMTNQR